MPNTGDRAVGVTLKIRRSRSGTEAPWTALAAEDEWPCYLRTITATAFLAISAAVSFASFTALILELVHGPRVLHICCARWHRSPFRGRQEIGRPGLGKTTLSRAC